MIDIVSGFEVSYSSASIEELNSGLLATCFFGEQAPLINEVLPESTGLLDGLGFNAAVVTVNTIQVLPEPIITNGEPIFFSDVYCEYYYEFDGGYASFTMNFEEISGNVAMEIFDIASYGYAGIVAEGGVMTIAGFVDLCDYIISSAA